MVGRVWKYKFGLGIAYRVSDESQTCVNCNIKFSKATESYSKFSIWWASNQEILSARLACTTADLIPYPFGSSIEEQIPVLPGYIQVPVPPLIKLDIKLISNLFYQVSFHSRCNNFLQDNFVTVVMLCKPDGGLPSMITPHWQISHHSPLHQCTVL